MGACFLHGNGGAPLNYRVQAYATEEKLDAAEPYENTIGVVTDVEITSHKFDTKQPSGETGMVWFHTADESGLSFNALKRNAIQIHPRECKQYYFDGSATRWTEKTVKTFTGDKWIPWRRKLWDYGKSSDGWKGEAIARASGDNSLAPIIENTFSDGSVVYEAAVSMSGILVTENKIDLTPYNTLVFDGTMKIADTDLVDNCALYIWSEKPSTYYSENFAKRSFGEYGLTLDVSDLDGEYYIGFGIYGDSTSRVYLKSLILETATIEGASE